jgi:hypothetical protein
MMQPPPDFCTSLKRGDNLLIISLGDILAGLSLG